MCTLLTLDRDTFLTDKHLFVARIVKDSQYNSDGFSLIAADPINNTLNIHLSSMNIGQILNMIDWFMASASTYGRIWLHSRAATTDFVGVAFNHGFTDENGTMIQHNGIVKNYRNVAVDSYNLASLRTYDAKKFMDDLTAGGELFANVFLIRPDLNSYGVVRMSGGMLHSDGMGNYSTNAVAGVLDRVPTYYHQEYNLLPVRSTAVPVPAEFNDPYDIQIPESDDELYSWDTVVKKIQAG